MKNFIREAKASHQSARVTVEERGLQSHRSQVIRAVLSHTCVRCHVMYKSKLVQHVNTSL